MITLCVTGHIPVKWAKTGHNVQFSVFLTFTLQYLMCYTR